jgi:hypothetical protein
MHVAMNGMTMMNDVMSLMNLMHVVMNEMT